MIDGVILSGLGAGLAYVLGYRVGRIRQRRAGSGQPPAVCPCGHAIGFHEDQTGKCHEQNETRLYTTNSYKDVLVPCECRHYSGPELISAFTLREVAQRPTTTDDGTGA